ncbi:ABC transporter permease [Streptomyces longisporus]|uniref:ABC transporter permease n=1 Tax=Streptomyces longisporus TaxID=1948 RepID=A0ABN3MP59_STRLO
MRDLIGAEWRKIWTGRAWWCVVAAAVLMCAMADAGLLQQKLAKTPEGSSTSEITSTLVQGWFMVELAAAVIAMVAVTREFGNGAISRSVLLSGGRGRLLAAKLIAVAGCGTVFALGAGVLAAASPWVFLAGRTQKPEWTATTTWTLLGVMLVIVVGAVWGALLGLLIRQQVAAILVLLISTWLVGEGLLRLVPEIGRFTIDEAMASVYRGGNADLLSIPWALAVLAVWIVAGTIAARTLFLRRDLP